MANKTVFGSGSDSSADAVNEAGGLAYRLEPKQALAQVAATGTFGNTYYSDARQQLTEVLELIAKIDDNVFLAKLALYAREKAFMKDMPAALLVALSLRDTELMHRIFDRVVDNGRVLRTVFQMIRSGQFKNKNGQARTGLSSSVQRAFQRWLNEASIGKLLNASIGNDPSLRDIFRMARPTPKDNVRRAMFGWLTDKEREKWAPATEADLPAAILALEAYRKAESAEAQLLIAGNLDSVRWDLLSDAAKGPEVWSMLARKMGPQALRMNINTLLRHHVFEEESMIDLVATRLEDEAEIRRSKQFPYQYFSAYLYANGEVPHRIKVALQKAAEIACGNVPELPGPVVIGLDVSGSMASPITGSNGNGNSSRMRCVDVAALFAAAILRRNPDSVVIPFDQTPYVSKIEAADTILSIAERLARYGGGGTDCSLPLDAAVKWFPNRKFAGAIIVSDNESWIGSGQYGSTATMTAWGSFLQNQRKLVGKNANPKLINIDLQPYQTTQTPESPDIINIGGFSDSVFNVVSAFLSDNRNRFISEVEAMEI